jgi:hypothetical protein
MVACSAATLAIVLHVIGLLAVSYGVADPVGKGAIPLPKYFFEGFASVVPYSVTGAWLTMAMTGQWRSKADWVDRLGTALGFAWIIGAMVGWICMIRIMAHFTGRLLVA